MKKISRLILIGVFLKLILLTGVSATIISFEDGWDETDDVFATGDDYITFASSGLDRTYSVDGDPSPDMWCIEVDSLGTDRSQNMLINGHETDMVIKYAYDTWFDTINSETVTVQNLGGTGDECDVLFWVDRNSTCDDVWLTSAGGYTGFGCPPDLDFDIALGDTQNHNVGGDNYEFTCLNTATASYIKCQAPSYTDLTDCMDDSFNDVNGGDNNITYMTCSSDESSGVDTTALCDVSNEGVTGYDFRYLLASHLTSQDEDIFAMGIPNATFNIWSYDFCGTSLFDRDLEATVYLTMFQEKNRVCSAQKNYDVYGYVEGYMPWYGVSGNLSLNYSYGSSTCPLGTSCVSSSRTTDNAEDLTLNACFAIGGSCYDNVRNQDETSTDYGGICGQCDNTSRIDDVFFTIAYESNPTGYYDNNQFDEDLACGEAEDALSFAVTVVSAFYFLLILLLVIIFIVIVVVFVRFALPVVILAVRVVRSFRRRRKDRNQEIK